MSEKHSVTLKEELRLAKEQLNRLTQAMNSSSDAIRITDMQGTLLYHNFASQWTTTGKGLSHSGSELEIT